MSIVSLRLFINKMIRVGADKSALGAINRPLRRVGTYRDLFGVEPRFSLRIEVKPKTNAEREKVEKFNGLLGKVSRRLRLL
jgi:hypothetical protein